MKIKVSVINWCHFLLQRVQFTFYVITFREKTINYFLRIKLLLLLTEYKTFAFRIDSLAPPWISFISNKLTFQHQAKQKY